MQCNALEYFEFTVEKYSSKLAVLDKNGALTFSDLRNRAQALASDIIGITSKINQPIGIYLPTKTADSLISLLAVLYSGNFYIPLDIKNPVSRLGSILENLEPEAVISSVRYMTTLIAAGVDKNKIVLIEESPSEVSANIQKQFTVRTGHVIDTDPAYIIYTSGSTGLPKGVVVPHRGIIDYIDWARDCFLINDTTIIGNQAPFYFDNSTLDIYLCFATGATLVLIPEELFMFPVRLLEFMVQTEVNFIFWVPAALINVANVDILDKTALPRLEKILFAGEIMPVKHLNCWIKSFPNALFANLYGPTEITVDSTYYIVDRTFEEHEALPIGKPCRNTDILILDGDKEVTEQGVRGELCVRGSSLALGYWNNIEKTEAAFSLNPLNPHYPERIYRTGDLVHLNEHAEIIFDGRMDFQIKHLGYRIELGEIEHAILALAEIGNACVLYNQEEKVITLFYEAKMDISLSAFRRQLLNTLPNYMLPKAYHRFDKLPKNQNGKIDRQKLALAILGNDA